MAIDQTLLDRARADGAAVLRLYRWRPACLSFGRHEPALRRYDRARLEARGIDTVRRPSGGRAVWHADELTYAFAAPASRFGSLPVAYALIHQLFRAALARLDVAAALAPRPQTATPLDAGACFSSAAGGELLVGGRKALGSAQLREGDALLQHGSLLLADAQAMVATFSLRAGAPPLGGAGGPPLGRAIDFETAADAVIEAAREWAPGIEPLTHGAAIAEAAATAHRKFADPAWTWQR